MVPNISDETCCHGPAANANTYVLIGFVSLNAEMSDNSHGAVATFGVGVDAPPGRSAETFGLCTGRPQIPSVMIVFAISLFETTRHDFGALTPSVNFALRSG